MDLQDPVFIYGQLYVALSRATSEADVKVTMKPDVQSRTENIIFPKALLRLPVDT